MPLINNALMSYNKTLPWMTNKNQPSLPGQASVPTTALPANNPVGADPRLGLETALLISAGLGLVGSLFGSGAASSAASTQAAAGQHATDVQYQMFQEMMEANQPWQEAGTSALEWLKNALLQGPGVFKPATEPGYQFGYQQFVEKPTLALAAATGGLGSGGLLKTLSQYSQDYASTKYNDWLNKWYKSLDPYFSLAGLGQASAGQIGQGALGTGANISELIQNIGNVQAGNLANQSNIWSSFLGGQGQNLLNYALMNQFLER